MTRKIGLLWRNIAFRKWLRSKQKGHIKAKEIQQSWTQTEFPQQEINIAPTVRISELAVHTSSTKLVNTDFSENRADRKFLDA